MTLPKLLRVNHHCWDGLIRPLLAAIAISAATRGVAEDQLNVGIEARRRPVSSTIRPSRNGLVPLPMMFRAPASATAVLMAASITDRSMLYSTRDGVGYQASRRQHPGRAPHGHYPRPLPGRIVDSVVGVEVTFPAVKGRHHVGAEPQLPVRRASPNIPGSVQGRGSTWDRHTPTTTSVRASSCRSAETSKVVLAPRCTPPIPPVAKTPYSSHRGQHHGGRNGGTSTDRPVGDRESEITPAYLYGCVAGLAQSIGSRRHSIPRRILPSKTAVVAGTAPRSVMAACTAKGRLNIAGDRGMPWVMIVDSRATTALLLTQCLVHRGANLQMLIFHGCPVP